MMMDRCLLLTPPTLGILDNEVLLSAQFGSMVCWNTSNHIFIYTAFNLVACKFAAQYMHFYISIWKILLNFIGLEFIVINIVLSTYCSVTRCQINEMSYKPEP